MYSKDDRSKDNRKNMKQHSHYNKQQRRGGGAAGNTSSSSPQTTAVRSIVDVADSSDEPRFARKGWSSSEGRSSLAPQKNRDILDTLPPMDDDDNAPLEKGGAPMDENTRAQLRAGDFKQLAQYPSLGGGHFSFGVEKEWNSIAEGQTTLHTKEAHSYFTLNLGLLNCGLLTIPLYKRMDYSTAMFTRQQIGDMNEAAEQAERIYQQRVLLESADRTKSPTAITPVAAAAAAVAEPPPPQDELDELLALTNTQLEQTTLNTAEVLTLQAGAGATATKNDVEQWLDSVLDE